MGMRAVWGATIALICAVGLAACGSSGGDTTTVIKEVQVPPSREPAASPSSTAARKPTGKAPNVVDLPLDVAERILENAGYEVAATNTDTTFGIVVPSHYTVCTQDDPRGRVVPVLAQKYGC